MEGLREQKSGRKVVFVESKFGCGVSEGSILVRIIAVPASCGEA